MNLVNSNFFTLFACFAQICCDSEVKRIPVRRPTIDKLECINNSKVCNNVTCSLASPEKFLAIVSIGCHLTKPIKKMSIRVKSYIINGKDDNKTNINVIFDFCSLLENTDHPIIKSFLPNVDPNLKAMLHACPYSGDFYVKNITLESPKMPMFTSTQGDFYRTELMLTRGQFYPILTIKMHGKRHIEMI